MLYDPRWEVATKPKSRFMCWLERQPREKIYDYTNPLNCPYARYLRSRGVFAIVSPESWVGLWLGIVPCTWIISEKTSDVLASRPWTFGALRQRAQASGL